MRKYFGAMFVLIVALALAVTSTALGAKPKPNQEVVVTKKCPVASAQKTYKGNVVVYVSGNGCVSIDDGAVAIASGNAVVVAHGNSSVVAKNQTTLVVYNADVTCEIKGKDVTVVSAIKGFSERRGARCLAVRGK